MTGPEFGTMMWEYCREKQWSLADLAEKLQVSKSLPGFWKRGKKQPKPDKVEAMIALFGLSEVEAIGFRIAAGMAHVPLEFRRVIGVQRYAASEAMAARRALRWAMETHDQPVDPRTLIALRPPRPKRKPQAPLMTPKQVAEAQRRADAIGPCPGARPQVTEAGINTDRVARAVRHRRDRCIGRLYTTIRGMVNQ